MDRMNSLLESAARLDRVGISMTRIGLVVVLVWIGSLKAYRHEDEGIVPFVASSPVRKFVYRQPAGEYQRHMNREGELVPANREWHERNGTLSFLITTPECWVPPLGSPEHGFPLLSGAGRLVVKDAIMMGAALVTMADSAKSALRKRIPA